MSVTFQVHVIPVDEKQYLVFHPESFTLLCAEKPVGDILKEYEKGSDYERIAKKLKISPKDCKDITEQFYEEIIAPLKPCEVHDDHSLFLLVLMIATDCNLNCTYCYGEKGRYGQPPQLMKGETAKMLIDNLLPEYGSELRNIKFFGGEPLINFTAIKQVIDYLEEELELALRYNIVTNGTVMTDEIIEYVKKYKMDISVSLDGPQSVHDIQRVFESGKGTYVRIMKNIEKMKEAGIDFGIECTYSAHHVRQGITLRDLFEFFRELTPYVQISPVLTKDDKLRVNDEYVTQLLVEPLEELLSPHPMYNTSTMEYLATIMGKRRTQRLCDARNSVTLFPSGKVYPCYFLTEDKFFMGHVEDADFPGERFRAVRDMMINVTRECVDGIQGKWFRFIPPVFCMRDVIFRENNYELHINEKREKVYEEILNRYYALSKNPRIDVVKENINFIFGKFREVQERRENEDDNK